MLGISEDGVPPVRLLHSFHIQTAFLLRQKSTYNFFSNIKKLRQKPHVSKKQKHKPKKQHQPNTEGTSGITFKLTIGKQLDVRKLGESVVK